MTRLEQIELTWSESDWPLPEDIDWLISRVRWLEGELKEKEADAQIRIDAARRQGEEDEHCAWMESE